MFQLYGQRGAGEMERRDTFFPSSSMNIRTNQIILKPTLIAIKRIALMSQIIFLNKVIKGII